MYITLEMLKEFYSEAKTIDAWLFEAKIKPSFLCLFSKSFFLKFILFLAVLDLRCGMRGLRHAGLFFPRWGVRTSRCGARALESTSSVVAL